MFQKILLVTALIIFNNCLYGQLTTSGNDLLFDDKNYCSENIIISDIGEIYDLDFRKRRFANWTFFTEFGGVVEEHTNPHFSVNLDAILESKENHMFNGRFGAGIIYTEEGVDIFIPGYLAFLFGHKNHFEIGAGANFLMSAKSSSQIVPAGIIGFRHQNPRGGLMYGLNLNITFPHREITTDNFDYVLEPWLSLRLGYTW